MNIHRRFVDFLAVVVLLAIPMAATHAQEQKTVAVISLSSLDALLGNVQYLTEAAGTADVGRMATMMAMPYMQGLNKQKPLGFVITTDGQQFLPLGFIPVDDLKSNLTLLRDQIGDPKDAGNGIMEFAGPQSVFVKEQNGWAFIGQTIESLDKLPQNPAAELGGLDKKYDIAVRAYAQNIPQAYRTMAVSALQQGMQQGLEQSANEDDAAYEIRQNLAKAQLQQIVSVVNDTDQITIGWKTDATAKKTYLDMTLTAVAGSSMARQMSVYADAESKFTAFLAPGAAIAFNTASKIPADQLQQNLAMTQNLRKVVGKKLAEDEEISDPKLKQGAQELVGSVFDIVDATLKTGKLDMGGAVLLKPEAMTFVVGLHVADGHEVDKVLRRAAELAKEDPDFPGINFDAESHSGVTFHTMSVPIPEDEKARKILHDQLDVAVGVGENTIYLGAGTECVKHLKEMVTKSAGTSAKSVPPFQLTVAATPILEFISAIEDQPLVGSVIDTLERSGGKDHVLMRGMPVENGVTYRLEVEEGILQAIGQGVKMGSAGGF